MGTVERFLRLVEDLDGVVHKAVLAVLFDEKRQRIWGGGEGEGFHLVEELPHSLVFPGARKGLDELLELDGGGPVVGLVPGPVEEAVALGGRRGARAEDAEDELGGDVEAELVEGALQVEIAPHNV